MTFDATTSSHMPSWTKMCDGMCTACAAAGRGRRQALERLPRRRQILLGPQWMVVAHRLAPVAEREGGIGFLRFAERVAGDVELEVVERLHANEERRLRGRFG